MAVAQKVAGFTLGQADILRKAMGKKKKSELDKQFEGFAAGMNGQRLFSARPSTRCGRSCLPFADYAFNKAHSAGYGILSYWTAYLKAQSPGRVHGRPADQRRRLQRQARDLPERVPADGHQGARAGCQRVVRDFTAVPSATGRDIRFGLGAVATSATTWSRASGSPREEKGTVRVVPRLPGQGPDPGRQQAHGRVADQGGRLRFAGHQRDARCSRSTRTRSRRGQRQAHRGQRAGRLRLRRICATNRRSCPRVPDRPEWSKKDKLAFEREMLGLYVSDHPLAGLELQLAKHASCAITELISGQSRTLTAIR